MNVIKAIIPAGGLGTRLLPFTKAVPKELLPLLDKPAIQYIVKEGMESDINDFIVVTSGNKQAIHNHFEPDLELELHLKERGKLDLLESLKRITRIANFTYVRQNEPRGLGHAIWTARRLIGKEYFGIFLPDDIIVSQQTAMSVLLKVARQEKASVIAIQEVPTDQVSSYGVIAIKKQLTPSLFQVSHILEKPEQKNAPSNLAVIGRYVLSHKIFPALEEIEADDNEELQLTDAISQMIHNNEKVFAVKVPGIRYDIGNPIGWIKATIGAALQDPQCAPHLIKFLEDRETLDSFVYSPSKIMEHQL